MGEAQVSGNNVAIDELLAFALRGENTADRRPSSSTDGATILELVHGMRRTDTAPVAQETGEHLINGYFVTRH